MSHPGFVGICRGIAPFGAALFLQSGLVLLLGLTLAALLRRPGPLAQSLVLRATLVAVVLTIGFSVLLTPYVHPLWRISLTDTPVRERVPTPAMLEIKAPAQPDWDDPGPSQAPTLDAFPTAPDTQVPPPSPESAVTGAVQRVPAASRPTPPLMDRLCPTLALIWGIGTSGLLLWVVTGQISLFALHRKSSPITAGPAAELMHGLCPERPLPLRVSPNIQSPFLGGLRHPTVFLPASFVTGCDGPTLRAVLAHELAHRDRNDNHWLLLTRLVCAALWVQPLCWVLTRCLEQASEEACDTLALQSGCTPRSYADCLLSLSQRLTPSPWERTMGSGSVPLCSQVGRRIQNVLHRKDNPMANVSRWMTFSVTIGLATAAVCGALFVSAGAAPARVLRPTAPASAQPDAAQSRDIDDGRFLAGLTAVQGPGIIVTLSDSHKKSPYGAGRPAYLIHDTDINMVINELKAAGAEALAVNDERLIATSPIRCAGPTVLVNNVPQTPPFVIRAIGNSVALQMALNLHGGVGSELRQLDPAMVRIKTTPHLVLPAYEGPTQGRYAKPAAMAEGTPSGGETAPDKTTSECESHLKIIIGAITQYAKDHQDRLPNAPSWMDEILPYVKDASIFHDPDARPTQQWSYAYNQSLSGVPLSRISQANGLSQTVIVFDSERNYILDPVEGIRNASNPGDALPYPGRHKGFNVFGFLDGHTQVLPTGQRPPFRPAATGQYPTTPPLRRPMPYHAVSTKSVLVKAYEGRITPQAEKAKKDWLDFKQSHPVTLSKVQIAQINTLINLRLQHNGLTSGMRMNAVLRAKHMARLAELGPGQEAERRKRRTEVAAIDAQTRQWQGRMPGIEQKIVRQEALVRPFADDYLEVQFKKQQYDILRSENIVVRQVQDTPRATRQAKLLQLRASLLAQLAALKKQVSTRIAVGQRRLTVPPVPTPAQKGSASEVTPIQQKQAYIRAVHAHNQQIVHFWEDFARHDKRIRETIQQQRELQRRLTEVSARIQAVR